nr:MAG TPA: hypothetical protein [Caudoviricetes sp.]
MELQTVKTGCSARAVITSVRGWADSLPFCDYERG